MKTSVRNSITSARNSIPLGEVAAVYCGTGVSCGTAVYCSLKYYLGPGIPSFEYSCVYSLGGEALNTPLGPGIPSFKYSCVYSLGPEAVRPWRRKFESKFWPPGQNFDSNFLVFQISS